MSAGNRVAEIFRDKIKPIVLCLSIGLFLILLAYGFPDSPSPWFDEGINLGVARSWVEHRVYSMRIGPNEFVEERASLITTNYPLLFFVAVAFKIFGVGLGQAKAVLFIFLALFLLLAYQLSKKMYGQNAALTTLALLVTFLPLYGNGKSALGEIPGLTYFLGGLLLLGNNKGWRVFATGILFGLAVATKPIYFLLFVGIVIGEWFTNIRGKKIDYKHLGLLFGGMAIPLCVWLYTLFPEKPTFSYLVKSFGSYSNPYETKVDSAFWHNLFRFVTETTPIHFILLFGTFVVAKLVTKLRSLNQTEVIVLVFILLDIVFYLRTPGWYRYFFPSHILVFILFPPAAWYLVSRIFSANRARYVIAAVFMVILLAAQLTVISSNMNTSLYYNPEPATFARQIDRLVAPDSNILVVDNPALAFMLKSKNVWQHVRISPHLETSVDLLKREQYPTYIVGGPWSEDVYLKSYMNLSNKYNIVVTEGRYSLYRLRAD